jgi:hypothetical protein
MKHAQVQEAAQLDVLVLVHKRERQRGAHCSGIGLSRGDYRKWIIEGLAMQLLIEYVTQTGV